MAERRAGGETGVAWVEALSGDEVWEKMRLNSWDEGGWSLKLVESALTRSHTLQQPRSGEKKEGNLGGSFCKRFPTLDEIEEIVSDPVAYRFMCAQTASAQQACVLASRRRLRAWRGAGTRMAPRQRCFCSTA